MKTSKNKMPIQMRGPLSFLILWIVFKKSSRGCDIAVEIEKRKGSKPSPGTVYPLLKDLVSKGLLILSSNYSYKLTKKGEKEMISGCKKLSDIFYDFDEIKKIAKNN